jgi:hypothetical protein
MSFSFLQINFLFATTKLQYSNFAHCSDKVTLKIEPIFCAVLLTRSRKQLHNFSETEAVHPALPFSITRMSVELKPYTNSARQAKVQEVDLTLLCKGEGRIHQSFYTGEQNILDILTVLCLGVNI